MIDKIQLIKLAMIDRPQKIARELIDPEKVRELAESIREVGLIEPVLLRPLNGRFEMVAGDRRFLAHQILNLKEIKAIVRELDDRETVIIRAIENLQRVDLTPSEEARFYLSLKEEGGLSTNQIAKKTGKSHVTIDKYLMLAKCPEYIRKAVDRKEVSMFVLETLKEIDDPTAFDYHFKMAVANGIAQPVARLWVDDYLKTKQGTYYNEDGTSPPFNSDIEIKPVFLTCEACHSPVELRKGRNMYVCSDCFKKVRHT